MAFIPKRPDSPPSVWLSAIWTTKVQIYLYVGGGNRKIPVPGRLVYPVPESASGPRALFFNTIQDAHVHFRELLAAFDAKVQRPDWKRNHNIVGVVGFLDVHNGLVSAL
jgi:hypothetical protein